MFKQIILPILGVIAFIAGVGILVQKTSTINLTQPTNKTSMVIINEKQINIEIADSEDERKKGLSGRDSLAKDSGMLFSFEKENSNPSFWMKDVKLAIDIIWINDEKIVKIDKNVPVPTSETADNQLPTYSAGQPIDHVLEVNGGESDEYNFKIGDIVDLSKI